jgi:hypothetical protein
MTTTYEPERNRFNMPTDAGDANETCARVVLDGGLFF